MRGEEGGKKGRKKKEEREEGKGKKEEGREKRRGGERGEAAQDAGLCGGFAVQVTYPVQLMCQMRGPWATTRFWHSVDQGSSVVKETASHLHLRWG